MHLTFVAAAALAAAPPAPVLVRYAGIALDPAGKRIATIDSEQVKGAPVARHGVLVIRDTAGRITARYDPCTSCNYAGPAWSPDGRSLAYVASGGGVATLYVLADGQNRKVASLKGLAAAPRWSPDGGTIAFLATPDATKETGATQPGARQVGVIGDKEDSKRIAIVPTSGGEYRLISPAGTFVYEYDWTPDGKGFVGTAAEGNGDNRWWVASLRAFPIDGAMRVIAAPKMQMNWPRISPDGRTVAFIGGLMSDYPVSGGDIYTVGLGGSEAVNLTPGYKATFTSLIWNGPRLIAGVTQGGSTGVATIDPATGKVVASVAPDTMGGRTEVVVAPDRTASKAAYVVESFTSAPRIAFGPLGKGRPITHDNDALLSGVAAQDIHWTNDALNVQGWLLRPAGAVATSKQPMITIVHGGPSSASTPRFPWGDEPDLLSRNGYWIFLPNPRGSFGQGEAFTMANVRDFGGGDLRDILAGIDAVEKKAPIDDARLGIYGHSYGGFMTMWAVTATNRFKGAVAGAGIANWISYYGQNGIDQWMIPFFGASAYDDPAIYDKLSPIRYVKGAKTPTLLYVGERDVECPPAQSLEYWHALKAMGVPTELVIYQDEGHGIRKPEHLLDRETRMIGWFDKWLGVHRP
ncbi:prolyl oligopeptidase family serine peptidase [Sphingomonas sp. MMS24-J13]|uniref:prolyl oligopeptidase family serine peptidase n=1 Tax=Sphingomonas sp. MMS24-J13 TaxID=3238686 RepID=UPI0038507CAD